MRPVPPSRLFAEAPEQIGNSVPDAGEDKTVAGDIAIDAGLATGDGVDVEGEKFLPDCRAIEQG